MLSIQIGQCGNQMGIEFWSQLLMIPELAFMPSTLSSAYTNFDSWLAVRNAFLHDDGTARMIAVDSEPKVVSHAYHMLHSLARATHALEPVPALTKSAFSPSVFNSFLCPGFGLTEHATAATNSARQPSTGALGSSASTSTSTSAFTSRARRLPVDALYYNPTSGTSAPKHVSPRFSRAARLEVGGGMTFDDYRAAYGVRGGDRDRGEQARRQGSRRARNAAAGSVDTRGGSGIGTSARAETGMGTGMGAGAWEDVGAVAHDGSFLFEQSGRGNNWALGFHGERRAVHTTTDMGAERWRGVSGGLLCAEDTRDGVLQHGDTAGNDVGVIDGGGVGGVQEPRWHGHRGAQKVVFGAAGRRAVEQQCVDTGVRGGVRGGAISASTTRKGRMSLYMNSDINTGVGVGAGRGGYFDTDTSVCGVGGRGRGLCGEGETHSLSRLTLGSLRRHLERADRIDALLLMHSLAGGTGSGLGARLTVEVRDYVGPRKLLFNVAAAPLRAGEVVLQHYNVALSLAALYDATDALWLCSTDDVLAALAAGRGVVGTAVRAVNKGTGTNAGSAAVATYQYLTALSAHTRAPPVFPNAASTSTSTSVSAHAPASVLTHPFPTLPPTSLQRDVRLLPRMAQSLDAFAPVNAAIAATLIDFLAPNMRLSPATRAVCLHSGQAPQWSPCSVVAEPVPLCSGTHKEERGRVRDCADEAECAGMGTGARSVIMGGEAFAPPSRPHTSAVVVTAADIHAAARAVAHSAAASTTSSPHTTTSTTTATDVASPGSFSESLWRGVSWTPPWACVSTQLRAQLMHLCPSADTKLIELWNTAAISPDLAAATPSTPAAAAAGAVAHAGMGVGLGGGDVHGDVWRRHCELILRALPRTPLHTQAPSSIAPAHARAHAPPSTGILGNVARPRGGMAVDAVALANAAAYALAGDALLGDRDTPLPARDVGGRWHWASASAQASTGVFAHTLSASVTLHGALPYRGEQSLVSVPSLCTASPLGAAVEGVHGLLFNGVGLTRPSLTAHHAAPTRVRTDTRRAAQALDSAFGEEDPLWASVHAAVTRVCPLPRWRRAPLYSADTPYTASDAAAGTLWSDEAVLFSLGQAPSFAVYARTHAATYACGVAKALSRCATAPPSSDRGNANDSGTDSGGAGVSVPRAELQLLSRACEQVRAAVAASLPRTGVSARPCAVSLALNRGRQACTLGGTVLRAQELLGVGAFTHWYERYGCTREELAASVEYCGDVVEAYYEMLCD